MRQLGTLLVAWLLLTGMGAGLLQEPPSGGNGGSIPADIPVPPGFHVDSDDSLIFDKPGGRILQIEMTGEGDWQTVRGFFLDSLAQLGWRRHDGPAGGINMTRGAEQLMITAKRETGALRVRFEIRPRQR